MDLPADGSEISDTSEALQNYTLLRWGGWGAVFRENTIPMKHQMGLDAVVSVHLKIPTMCIRKMDSSFVKSDKRRWGLGEKNNQYSFG